MKYLYYPGCSLEGTAKEYDAATRAIMAALEVELAELEDWTCCGATAADSVSHLLSLCLPARNLALAQRQQPDLDILVPCSACYLNLKRAETAIGREPHLLTRLNEVLAEDGLRLEHNAPQVRHLLDILVNDIGPSGLDEKISRTLSGLTVAPYYGCQCLRPYAVFDDPEEPHSMDGLIRATGADLFDWSMGAKCCGASHMNTKMSVAFELTGAILHAARASDAIVTVCPMCQLNLEAYQAQISRLRGETLGITVLYLPQLIGLALGIDATLLEIDLNLSVTDSFRAKLSRLQARAARAV